MLRICERCHDNISSRGELCSAIMDMVCEEYDLGSTFIIDENSCYQGVFKHLEKSGFIISTEISVNECAVSLNLRTALFSGPSNQKNRRICWCRKGCSQD